MEHISTFIAARRQQLQSRRYQLSMFHAAQEKGSAEWSTFAAVRGDRVYGYPVRLPSKPIVTREPGHILRIVYPNPHFQPAN